MGLETGTHINDLVITNPSGAVDQKQFGDDHLRLIKTVLKNTFPNMAGGAWRTQAKSGAYTALTTDNMTLLVCTNTWTLALTAAATLDNKWMAVVANVGSGTITIDPNGAETINGATTYALPSLTAGLLFCTGSSFYMLQFSIKDTNGVFWFTEPVTMASKALWLAKGAAVAAATTCNIWATDGNALHITGTGGPITSFGTAPQAGAAKIVIVDDVVTLTNGANLVLPTAADIVTQAGDTFIVFADTTAKMYVFGYTRADGTPLKIADGSVTNAMLAGPATDFIVRSNSVQANTGIVTLENVYTDIVTLSLGSVVAGDIILFTAPFRFTGGSGGLVTSQVVKSAGTASIHPSGYHTGSSVVISAGGCLVSGIIAVEGSGTLTITLQGAEAGSPSAFVPIGNGFIRAVVLKGG